MPHSEQHIKQASQNLSFLTSFYSCHKFNDWAITVGFYTALHVVENAIFLSPSLKIVGKAIKILHSEELQGAAKKVGISLEARLTKHGARRIVVQENFVDISVAYKSLEAKSQTARYHNYNFKDGETDMLVRISLKEILEWSNEKFKTSFPLL